MEKIPNWLRYTLAIPFGIVCSILGYYIIWFSNVLYASPDSLYMFLIDYLYNNCFNAVVLIYSMNYMLPKHQFKFTLVVSIIFCGLGFVGLGMSIIMQNITTSYIIGLILTFIAFIGSCCYTFNEYPIQKQESINNYSYDTKNINIQESNEDYETKFFEELKRKNEEYDKGKNESK
jgi:hypothetical protein